MASASRITQLERDLAGLREKAAKERETAAKERFKANRARGQITRTSSTSSASSKEKDASKAEEKASKADGKAAGYDKQAAAKLGALETARSQFRKAQERDEKKQSDGRKRERERELRDLQRIETARRQAQEPPAFSVRPVGVEAQEIEPATPQFDVCLSFAGEQRSYVELVAGGLKKLGYRVFYDADEEAALWGKDLPEHLDLVYRELSRVCIMFISAEYASKPWTRHERRSALARAIEDDEYVLPARFDDTELPGLRPTIKYVDLSQIAPQSLVDLIAEKLGPPLAGSAAGESPTA